MRKFPVSQIEYFEVKSFHLLNLDIILPCSYGENVPASIFIYGSILIDVTAISQLFSNVPKELDITPFPTPLITPPVTKIYFILLGLMELLITRTRGVERLHITKG